MAGRNSLLNPATIALVAAFAYLYVAHLQHLMEVLGVFRTPVNTPVAAENFVVIEGTQHCEDLQYHETSQLLFAACESVPGVRHKWFPPLAHFFDASTANLKGGLYVIDPKTMKGQKLILDGFENPFVTHGIDVISDPERPDGEAVYIFAINHMPDKGFYGRPRDILAPKSHSVVEIFYHVVGSGKARHIRSVWDPLITTPNDVLALSPTSFFVTNDHHYKDGPMRFIEDIWAGARWSYTLHIKLAGLDHPVEKDSDGVEATIALDKMHTNNGLSFGRTQTEILVSSPGSGQQHIGELIYDEDNNDGNSNGSPRIKITQVLKLPSCIDNMHYFKDPYANATFDASGIVNAGLSRGIDLGNSKGKPDGLEPIMVWKSSPAPKTAVAAAGAGGEEWDMRLLFEDDGHRVRSASVGVLLAIDPRLEQGQRRGWLFVSGYFAKNIIAVKIDLE